MHSGPAIIYESQAAALLAAVLRLQVCAQTSIERVSDTTTQVYTGILKYISQHTWEHQVI